MSEWLIGFAAGIAVACCGITWAYYLLVARHWGKQ